MDTIQPQDERKQALARLARYAGSESFQKGANAHLKRVAFQVFLRLLPTDVRGDHHLCAFLRHHFEQGWTNALEHQAPKAQQ
jgi:hypothetical protein